jgi:2-oxoisovalerate ferredoxin oxidoreductase beta subunit
MYVKAQQRPKSLYGEFERKPGDHLTTHYCPGCGHGNLHKYVAEAIDAFGVQDRTIFVSPVGCAVFAYYYFDVGNVQAAHGRAPAVATAVKRARPESLVISYQGDGDLAAIGGNEILHAANRGENISVIFVNNAIYGMTGGQMAPTTILGQRSTTSPWGRSIQTEGFPLRVSELLASLEGPTYIERVALFDNKSRMKARKAIRKAIQNQIEGRGFSLVEVLSPCPTGWGVTPVEACEWVKSTLAQTFPIGVIKDVSAEREGWTRYRREVDADEIRAVLAVGDPGDRAVASLVPDRVAARDEDVRIKIAGFGGQGLLFLGKLLAEAGMRQGRYVSWLPSYGPEMRGGTANCHVNISTRPIGSPLISDPTILIAMNRPSLEKFENELIAGGLLIYDSSLIDAKPSRDDVKCLALPATALADEVGSPKVANMVTLGALVSRTGMFEQAELLAVVEKITKNRQLLDLNIGAIEAGYGAASVSTPDEYLWGV